MRSRAKAIGEASWPRGREGVLALVAIHPASLPDTKFGDLRVAAAEYDAWLRATALPLWAGAGVDPVTGAFREALTWAGAPHDPRRRARVQARQAFVYATAAAEGLPGPWLPLARGALDLFLIQARRADGLFAAILAPSGAHIDPTAYLYEHAFLLLALSALHRADPGDARVRDEAVAIASRLGAFRHPAGGFREAGARPFQANAQMHLFEAALAWEVVGEGDDWRSLADELATLALDRFIDPVTGALSEFFDADWRRLSGDAGLIEPGHQFEWAWLLERWGLARGHSEARAAARRLFAAGRRGFDVGRNVVVDALADDLAIRDAGARLWPQTEHLKAALILGDAVAALQGVNGLRTYLDAPTPGVWRERMRADGTFIEEPSPATSFYHLFLAIRELARFAGEAC